MSTSPAILNVDLAGMVCALHVHDEALALLLHQRYAAFLNPVATAEITIEIVPRKRPPFIHPQPGDWVIETSFTDDQLRYTSYLERGTVDLAAGRGMLELISPGDAENFLRVVFAWFCLHRHSLLLHASGMIRQGAGYAFFGHSGSGKTTTTRLSAPFATILSDDLVIIRPCQGVCTLHGVPFRGEFGESPRANQQAPLAGIFRLRQDNDHRIVPLSRSIAAAELGASAPFVNNKPALAGMLMETCHQIVKTTEVHALHFRQDADFWSVIDDYLTSLP